MTLADISSLIATVASVILVIYAALAYHRPKAPAVSALEQSVSRGPMRWAPLIFVVIAWSAVAFDYYDRHYRSPVNVALIEEYGWISQNNQSALHMAVDGRKLSDLADGYKLLFIARTVFANVDKMSDPFLAKSVLYTITPEPISLAIPSPKLRINVGQINTVEFDLVALPTQFSADQITTLSDVQRLGGKVLDTRGKTDILQGTPAAAP